MHLLQCCSGNTATEAMFCSWRAACRARSAATSASSPHLLHIIKSEPIATWAVSSPGTRAEPRRAPRCRSWRTQTSSQLLPSLPLATMVKVVKVHECGGTEKLKFEDVEVGKPGPSQARVKHTAIGLNMIDAYFRKGWYKVDLPFTPGMEAAGTVEEVGSDVTEVRVGDRVCYAGAGMGSYAEERLIPADKLVKIPNGVDDVSAAAIILKGMTTQILIHKTFKVEKGQTVLVHAAAGGVGSLMVQWASSLGATVIGCVSTEEKAKKAKADGAHHVILYSEKNLVQRVKEITNGVGVPVVYDSVGKDTFQDSLDCLAFRGMLVLYGQSSGPPEPIPVSALAARSLFVTRPSLMHYTQTREELEEVSSDVFANVANGVLKIRVHATYPLSQVAKGHDDLEGRKTTGSTVFIPDSLFK